MLRNNTFKKIPIWMSCMLLLTCNCNVKPYSILWNPNYLFFVYSSLIRFTFLIQKIVLATVFGPPKFLLRKAIVLPFIHFFAFLNIVDIVKMFTHINPHMWVQTTFISLLCKTMKNFYFPQESISVWVSTSV